MAWIDWKAFRAGVIPCGTRSCQQGFGDARARCELAAQGIQDVREVEEPVWIPWIFEFPKSRRPMTQPGSQIPSAAGGLGSLGSLNPLSSQVSVLLAE